MSQPGIPFRPGAGKPKGFDTQVQDIASAAHLRGVVLMRGDTVVGSLEAADLCRTMRAAHENTRGLGPGTTRCARSSTPSPSGWAAAAR